MHRLTAPALSLLLLTPVMALDAPTEKVIDLRLEGELCRENTRQNIPDAFDDQADDFKRLQFENTRINELTVARLAASDNAEDHLYRASLLRSEPLLEVESLSRALEIDPDSLFVLRTLGARCLHDDLPFCTEITNRLAESPDSSANELLLAAALYHHAGRDGIESLYEKSVQRGFSNSYGQDLSYAWKITQDVLEKDQPDLELLELDQTGDGKHTVMAFGIAIALSSHYGAELFRVCNPQSSEPTYPIGASICRDLALSLAEKGSDQYQRALGTALLLRIAEAGTDAGHLAEARQARQRYDDLSARFQGLTCYDEGRFQDQYMATVEYLQGVVENGEIDTMSSLIDRIERGELQ